MSRTKADSLRNSLTQVESSMQELRTVLQGDVPVKVLANVTRQLDVLRGVKETIVSSLTMLENSYGLTEPTELLELKDLSLRHMADELRKYYTPRVQNAIRAGYTDIVDLYDSQAVTCAARNRLPVYPRSVHSVAGNRDSHLEDLNWALEQAGARFFEDVSLKIHNEAWAISGKNICVESAQLKPTVATLDIAGELGPARLVVSFAVIKVHGVTTPMMRIKARVTPPSWM